MSLPPLEPVIARQLRKEGVTDVNIPPDEASWARLLRRISEHYRHVEEDRVRLSRSLETSTEEMTALHGRLEEERYQKDDMLPRTLVDGDLDRVVDGHQRGCTSTHHTR